MRWSTPATGPFVVFPMPNEDIVVIGASSGGIEVLQALVGALTADFHGTIFVVVHIGPYGLNTLDRLLAKAGKLPASIAKDWEEFQPGHIYVAPADHHLILEPTGYTRLTRGPKENRTARPGSAFPLGRRRLWSARGGRDPVRVPGRRHSGFVGHQGIRRHRHRAGPAGSPGSRYAAERACQRFGGSPPRKYATPGFLEQQRHSCR